MPLQYPPEWKFEMPAIEMPWAAHLEFRDLALKIAVGYSARLVYETFKESFGRPNSSSSLAWAQEDMETAMSLCVDDAVGYVTRFWSALEALRQADVPVPSERTVNKILASHGTPLVVEPPLLHITPGDAVVVPASVTDPTPRAGRLIRGELIGQGGFGMVYKATRTTSVATFDYALKLLDPSPFIEDHEKASKRFARESRALQRLQHRAIVPYVETGMIDGNQAYILMPLIEGRTLRDAGMDPERVLWTFGEILGGLVYLHAQNIIHRDLKPSNIIVRSSDLQPLILDFGCAYLFDDVPEKTLTNTLIGSAAYVPPEVHADPTMRDPRQDIYACGIMLYEVLRGHRPDPNEYVTLESMISGLAPLDDLVQAAIAPFKKRIATAKEFENRLTAISI